MATTQLLTVWNRLKDQYALRVGAVYAGASWFLVEAADTLGMDPARIRVLALILAGGFVVIVSGAWLVERRRSRAEAPGWVRGRHWALWTAALVVLAAVLGWFGARRIVAAVPPDAQRIAVVPFRASGSEEIREFGLGLSNLLAAALDDVGGIRTVPARTVAARLSRLGEPEDVALEDVLRAVRETGAGAALTGTVTSAGGGVRINGELRRTEDGGVMASAEVQGSPDGLLALTDQLAVELLRQLWRSKDPLPTVRVAALTTTSPTALRAYLQGEQHLRSVRFDSAADAFRRATELDSTFALAWLRLSQAVGWNSSASEGRIEQRQLGERAMAFADRLPERERAYLRASILNTDGALAAPDTIEAYVRRFPDDPDGWMLLGDARFHAGRYGFFADDEIIQPFFEAARLDPTFGLGLFHALDMSRDRGDREVFDSLLVRFAAVAPERESDRWRRQAAVRWAPPDSVVQAFVEMIRSLHPVADRVTINAVIGALGNITRLNPAVDPGVYAEAVDSLERMFGDDRYWKRRALNLRAGLFSGTGRPTPAFEALDQWLATDPPGRPPAPRAVQRAVMRIGQVLDGEAPASMVEEDVRIVEENLSALPDLDAMLQAYALRASDAELARRHPFRLQLGPLPPDFPPVDTIGVQKLYGGFMAVFTGDTAAALRGLDEGLQRLGYWDANDFPFLPDYAEILTKYPERRLQGIRILRWLATNWNVNTGRYFLVLGRALEAEGDRAGAREAYGHVLRLWSNAEPFRDAEVDEARRALDRLAVEG